MTRTNCLFAAGGLAVVLALPATPLGSQPSTARTDATVNVKCHQGQSINQALQQQPNAHRLIVEISGMCHENVIVTRDRVTLRGGSPDTDGIRAVLNTNQTDAALWVKSAHEVRVENLGLTGGFAGLLATEASTPFLTMSNCRLEGNVRGTILEASLLQATDTVFTANTTFNVLAFLGSRFGCERCTLSDPGAGTSPTQRTNLLLGTASSAVIFDSTFTNGGISVGESSATITDSTIGGFGSSPALSAVQGLVTLTRVQVAGALRVARASNLALIGATQISVDSIGNIVDDSSYVRIGDAPPAPATPPSLPSVVLGLTLRGFSNGTLNQTSGIGGNLTCASGANAFCANPGNVSGTSSCALCPKP